MIFQRLQLSFLIFFISVSGFAQGTASIYGRVSDETGRNLDLVNVALQGFPGGSITDSRGRFELRVPADTSLVVSFSFIGYQTYTQIVKLRTGEKKQIQVNLSMIATNLPTSEVRDQRLRSTSINKLNPKQAQLLPSIGGGIEDLIKTLPGVSSNNELSSQYTVRGGNFDENLVYVNGIEIYRPFLIRSGQQEGLSFLNPALVSSISFSAGGFTAEYGDKLSSVLDVTYKRPTETAASVGLSLLGADFHIEGRAAKDRLSYLLGARYKTTQYVLSALETQGSYKPDFMDIQALIQYEIDPKWELSLLGYYSRNKYKLVPKSRQTDFGTFSEAYRLNIYFDGQEVDQYATGTTALTLSFQPHRDLDLKLIASAYSTAESETYDIQSQYWIGKLETSSASEQFGNVVQSQGIGTFIEHARNYFYANVINLDHKGTYINDRSVLKWGARYQFQQIDDKISEWEMIDSAGFSLPHPTDFPGIPNPDKADFIVNENIKAHNTLNVNSLNGYLQNSWTFFDKRENEFTFTAGIRANYRDQNKEWTFSPRASLGWRPNWEKKMVFRLATGLYNQPPFYREMRLFDGSIYPNAVSQQSFQVILGTDLSFHAWNRPFVFTGEMYYKYLFDLVPYEVDNVRIRYYADELATGYAAGIDLKINGEFVPGIESWASLSFMKTAEDIIGDSYIDYPTDAAGNVTDTLTVFPGFIPRPSDQRVQFSIFFQDYIPRYPTFRVNVKLLFGTGLPFGQPNTERYQQTRRMPPYRRVDIGFSKQLIGEDSDFGNKNILRHIKNLWLNLEVFNLLQINNTVSYIWIKDVNNIQYGVPNYLTPRQLNLKIVAEF
jgi:hypothetical protein